MKEQLNHSPGKAGPHHVNVMAIIVRSHELVASLHPGDVVLVAIHSSTAERSCPDGPNLAGLEQSVLLSSRKYTYCLEFKYLLLLRDSISEQIK